MSTHYKQYQPPNSNSVLYFILLAFSLLLHNSHWATGQTKSAYRILVEEPERK